MREIVLEGRRYRVLFNYQRGTKVARTSYQYYNENKQEWRKGFNWNKKSILYNALHNQQEKVPD